MAVSDTPGWRLFLGVFEDASRRGLPLVPLRPRERDPATALSGGDYDFLLPPDAFPLAGGPAVAAGRGRRRQLQHQPHESPASPRSSSTCRGGQEHPARALDPPRGAGSRDGSPPAGFPGPRWRRSSAPGTTPPRLPPEVEIACYLSHLATRRKRIETPLVSARLAAYAALGGDAGASAPGSPPRGSPTAGIPAAAAAANDRLRELGVLERRTPGAQASTRPVTPWPPDRGNGGGDSGVARIIAVTGPDGVGKSTVIARWGA